MPMVDVTLPDLGPDAGDEAQVSFWYFDVGEAVKKENDDLLEMITDKATFNVPCPVSGTLVELRADEGGGVHGADPAEGVGHRPGKGHGRVRE